jgi:uncharacterized membrane protein
LATRVNRSNRFIDKVVEGRELTAAAGAKIGRLVKEDVVEKASDDEIEAITRRAAWKFIAAVFAVAMVRW